MSSVLQVSRTQPLTGPGGGAAAVYGDIGVMLFVAFSSVQEWRGFSGPPWELMQVTVDMSTHLTFGLCNESQTPFVSSQSSGHPNQRMRARIPDGVEQAAPILQLQQAVMAPVQVIALLLAERCMLP